MSIDAGRISRPTVDHALYLFEGEADLISTAGARLADALAAGGSIVIVAAPAHLAAFEDYLRTAGVDLTRARADGTLRSLDAQETLDRFMVGGLPDRDRFDAVLRATIREAIRPDADLTVFGEMVALLWDQGNVTGALALEESWDELLATEPFSLICAYARSSLSETDGGAVPDVCRAHREVIDPGAADDPPTSPWRGRRADRRFDGRTAPRDARAFAGGVLRDWGLHDRTEDAVAIVSELTANAVVHAASDPVVMLSTHEGTLRIAVQDGSPGEPVAATDPSASATTGRGLALVSALSDRWGYIGVGAGKRVWAELSLDGRRD